MEFSFSVQQFLPDRITIFEGGKTQNNGLKAQQLQLIINQMGVASAKAQGLRSSITTFDKLLRASDQRLYILREEKANTVVGFIKTGKRRLFLRDTSGLLHEVVPLCILDFYVHESQQRKGYGKYLFEQVLQNEDLQPFEVAIDRPSTKFLKFLQKHYNLQSFVKQNNNFVVFDKFFSTCVHYDHGYGIHRRYSLPIRSEGPLSPFAQRNHQRMSLSPTRNDWSSRIDTDSQAAVIPTHSPSPVINTTNKELETRLSDQKLEKQESPVDYYINKEPRTKQSGIANDFISSSEHVHVKPVIPVHGNRHAPHLTLREHKRKRHFNILCMDQPAVTYEDENRYSRYESTSETRRSNPQHISQRGGIDPPYATSTYTRDDLKRNHWKSFLK